MKKHKLHLFELISRRIRGKIFWLLVITLAAAIADYYTTFLGDLWYLAWVAAGILLVLWFYYAILFRRGSLKVRPNGLRLQGPLWHLNFRYDTIYTVTAGHMDQHYSYKQLNWREKALLRPLYGPAGVFVQLKSVPPGYRWRRLWFPRYLFGTRHDGLLLCGGDWMNISQDIETARAHWLEKYGQRERRGQTSAQRLGIDEGSSNF